MKTRHHLPRFGVFLPLLLIAPLSACAVGPNHKAPEVATPEAHRGDKSPKPEPTTDKKDAKNQEKAPPTLSDLPWWEVYRDPKLFQLIKTATENAYDLRIALARVEIARQSHRAAAWAQAPTIGVNGGAGDALGAPTVPGVYPPQSSNGAFGINAGASWEPDVWGRLRRMTEVAHYNMEAADEDRRGVYIALVGDVAELYFELVALDQQYAYAKRAVETRQETLDLFSQRAGGGVGNELEVARALASLKEAEAAITQLDLSTVTNENALSYLLAQAPGPIEGRSAMDSIPEPPEIPPGLPSTLLKRRPDIRSAEKRLLSANASIGVKKADFFPKFELTAFLGVASPNLKSAQMVRGGAGLFSWTLPFLGGERIRAGYAAAKANWEGATADYERTVVNAFREVADSLAAVQALQLRRDALKAQVEALETAERLAVDRYRGGVANYLDVLTAQEDLLSTQLEIASISAKQMTAISRLYRNLGGGWPIPDEEEEDEDDKDKKSESQKSDEKKGG